MSLKAQLDICRCSFEVNAAMDLVAAMQRSIRQLTETSLVANAVKAGETAPRFRLPYGCRGFVDLSDLLDRGPVVVSFFWGDWCPFCALELKALAQAYAEIERLGATLVALSPQDLGQSSCPGSDSALPFPILRDFGCEIAVRYRIAFTIPRQFRGAYLALGYPNPGKVGSKGWVAPIPATYVLNSTGLVVLSYLDADHTTRLEPTEIIVALTHLRAGSAFPAGIIDSL
jgi:peroxiredoxin